MKNRYLSTLFSSSVDLAVKVAEERLREDASLGQRTSLPVEDIGTAMGSPVSVANMVMKHVKQRALATSPVKPFFWKRYVDDVISAVSGNEAERLLSHLNPEGPSIQFHLECKRIDIFPFLIQKCADGTRGIRDKCVS